MGSINPLKARKNQLDKSLVKASMTICACADTTTTGHTRGLEQQDLDASSGGLYARLDQKLARIVKAYPQVLEETTALPRWTSPW